MKLVVSRGEGRGEKNHFNLSNTDISYASIKIKLKTATESAYKIRQEKRYLC